MRVELEDRLERWTADGLISPDQAAAIRARERDLAARGGRSSLVAEAVGYVGAALALVAGSLVVSDQWEALGTAGRIGLVATLTGTAFAAGWAIRDRDAPAVARLASVLWLAAAGGTAFTTGLVTADVVGLDAAASALAVGLVVTAAAGLMYLRRRTTLQQLALGGGVVTTLVAAAALPETPPDPVVPGLLVWALGTGWALVASLGRLRPRATGQALGLLAVIVGAEVAAADRYAAVGVLLGLGSTAVVLVVSVLARNLLLLGFAVAGLFVFVPHAVFHFFGDSLGAPVALLVTGLVLIAAAAASVRLGRDLGTPRARPR